MLRKLIVAVLACLTLFLSKRSMLDGPAHAHAHGPRAVAAHEAARGTATAMAYRPGM